MSRNIPVITGEHSNTPISWCCRFSTDGPQQKQKEHAAAIGVSFDMLAPILLPEAVYPACRWYMGQGRLCGVELTRATVLDHYSKVHSIHGTGERKTCCWVGASGGCCGDTQEIRGLRRHLVETHHRFQSQCPLCGKVDSRPRLTLTHFSRCEEYKKLKSLHDAAGGRS